MVIHDAQVAFQQSWLWHNDCVILLAVGLHWPRKGRAGMWCCRWNFRVALGFLFIFTLYRLRAVKPSANSCYHLMELFSPSSSFPYFAVLGETRILSARLVREICQLWYNSVSPMLWIQKLERNETICLKSNRESVAERGSKIKMGVTYEDEVSEIFILHCKWHIIFLAL